MNYILTRVNNTINIQRLGVLNLFATLYRQTNCDLNEYEVVIPEQAILVQANIIIPNVDGYYKLVLTDKSTYTDDIYINNYKAFLKSFVEEVKDILCGCHCSDCDDCGKESKDYLSVLVKMFSYNIVNGGMYNQFFTDTNNCIKCDILDINQCMLLHETILGSFDNTQLMKKIIAYYYLVYYYTDLKLNQNSPVVTELYNYKNIIKCLRKLGINESCINSSIVILNPEGIFTVEFNTTFV